MTTRPEPGLVIRYAYLWRSEAEEGRIESSKDRPCAVVVTTIHGDGRTTVYVAPITHRPPSDSRHAIEIPLGTKKRLGLDDERSWIITNDLNAFTWPGPDIRFVGGGEDRGFAYGALPKALMIDLVLAIRRNVREGRARPVRRDE